MIFSLKSYKRTCLLNQRSAQTKVYQEINIACFSFKNVYIYLIVESLFYSDPAANIHKQNDSNNHLYTRRETDSPLHMLVERTAWNSRQNNPLDTLNYIKYT